MGLAGRVAAAYHEPLDAEVKMKRYFLAVTLLLIIPVGAISSDMEPLSQKYLKAFSKGNFENAATFLHCPESYTPIERKKDISAITKSLEIFDDEFGPLKEWAVSSSNMYITATTACGTVPYWEKHPIVKTQVFATKHENGKSGFIVLNFSEINNKPVLAFANHGIKMAGENSINRVKQVYHRLEELMK